MTRSEQKRIAIIEAAKEEFIQNGFAAANMNNVSAAAEVSKRTLYRHFESKEKLFEEVLAIVQQEIERKIRYPFDPDISLQQQLTDITLKEVHVLYEIYGISFSRTIVMEFFRQPEMAKSLSQRLYHTRAVSHWFEQAISHGALKNADLQTMTTVYVSLFQGLLFWPQVLDISPLAEDEVLMQKVDTIVSTVLAAYAPD